MIEGNAILPSSNPDITTKTQAAYPHVATAIDTVVNTAIALPILTILVLDINLEQDITDSDHYISSSQTQRIRSFERNCNHGRRVQFHQFGQYL